MITISIKWLIIAIVLGITIAILIKYNKESNPFAALGCLFVILVMAIVILGVFLIF